MMRVLLRDHGDGGSLALANQVMHLPKKKPGQPGRLTHDLADPRVQLAAASSFWPLPCTQLAWWQSAARPK